MYTRKVIEDSSNVVNFLQSQNKKLLTVFKSVRKPVFYEIDFVTEFETQKLITIDNLNFHQVFV